MATIALTIAPHEKDLGGFVARRLLPAAEKQTVGPFIFFDHLGPVDFPPGRGVDVRPHPHIGLATVTYLFDGELLHRDTLGIVQPIRPGEVNWMTAGRGIVHSERTGPEVRAAGHRLHAIQTWVALPADQEECEPSFQHEPAAALPHIERDGIRLRLIVGAAYGEVSPVRAASPIFYLHVEMEAGARLTLPDEYEERSAYLVDGAVSVEGEALIPRTLSVFVPGVPVTLAATAPSRLMLAGGAPLDGPRTLWWNFVSSRPERIDQAGRDWVGGRFGQVSGETEFIPLPERR